MDLKEVDISCLKNNKICYSFFLLICSISLIQAQEGEKEFDIPQMRETARHLYETDNFLHALHKYEVLDSLVPNDTAIQYALAVCYIDVFIKMEKAIDLLHKVKDAKPKNGNVLLKLAKAYNYTNQLDKAKQYYTEAIDAPIPPTLESIEHIQRRVEMCDNATFYLANPLDPEKTKVQNIGDVINTQYNEYVPVVSEDQSTLIFTYRGPGCTGGLQNTEGKEDELGFYFEDVFISYGFDGLWTIPVSISENVNTNTHDAVTSITKDEKTMLIYHSDGIHSDILVTELDTVAGDWAKPYKLSPVINTKYFESHATFTGDGSIIYFSTEKPGGYGGLDIYKTTKAADGFWSDPVNLGENINTPYDDDGPFIHQKSHVLYFSSEGHTSMGGYDIFRSIDFDGEWTKPQNMAYPINTTNDDLYFSVSPDGLTGYFGSKRKEGYGLLDIYTVNLDNLSLPFFSGEVDKNIKDQLDQAAEEQKAIDKAKADSIANEYSDAKLNSMSKDDLYNMVLEKFGNETKDGLIYKVQVGAYRNAKQFQSMVKRIVPDSEFKRYEDGITRFYSGNFDTMNSAEEKRNYIKKEHDIRDAFVSAIYKGKIISMKEVIKLFTQ